MEQQNKNVKRKSKEKLIGIGLYKCVTNLLYPNQCFPPNKISEFEKKMALQREA